MFDGAVISSLSIVKYCKKPVDVYILTMDLTERNKDYAPITEAQREYIERIYKEVNAESEVRLIDLKEIYLDSVLDKRNEETAYTPYAFLRLYADRLEFLPDKVLYLDTDTVLCGDISKLYEEDVSAYEFAAVRDRYGHWFFGWNYINTGVLLLNLKRIRQTRLFPRALALCAEKKLFLPDQTALNRLAKKKRILPRKYNEQKRERKDTLIRHFSMTIVWMPFHRQNVKPWHIDLVHEKLKTHYYDDILNDYLQRKPEFPERES